MEQASQTGVLKPPRASIGIIGWIRNNLFNGMINSILTTLTLFLLWQSTVSQLISAFKDTALVVIIALFDLLKATQSVLSNPEWMGFSREAYVFLAILYFLGCFSMSNYSRKQERADQIIFKPNPSLNKFLGETGHFHFNQNMLLGE